MPKNDSIDVKIVVPRLVLLISINVPENCARAGSTNAVTISQRPTRRRRIKRAYVVAGTSGAVRGAIFRFVQSNKYQR